MAQRLVLSILVVLALSAYPLSADEANTELRKLATDVLTKDQRSDASGMLDRDIRRRTDAFNVRNREAWYKIRTRDEWEQYRDERISRLRRSLGDYPQPGKPRVKVTGIVPGDGFQIENLLYEGLGGQWVAGNLYRPSKPGTSMPGILIAHSHHRGKTESELQDMGMTWARAGCLVLVIDQVGYGERRSHPFNTDADFPKPFKAGRQDYYFRYDTGVQLQLLGDSLMGWMAWDLMRGVDLLLTLDGIDPKRIILLGAVAAGGDVAGVTAALDPRIACCVPFNFGGPQPETSYPLPDDAETSFNYLLFTYWDSSRGLRLGARDDFPHWLIVASTAPRYLIYGHEFSWDKDRDPVWKRFQKVWGGFYGAADHLGVATGKGTLNLQPPEASHANNIGAFHRRSIHPLFDQWFGIKVTSQDEYSSPRKSSDLTCFTESARQELQPRSLNDAMSCIGRERVKQARARLAEKTLSERRQLLRDQWSKLLGPVTPASRVVVKSQSTDEGTISGAIVQRIVLEVEPGIVVPVILLTPAKQAKPAPVVVAVAQTGKAGFCQERSAELQKLVQSGVMVVLPDLRGTGETRAGDGRGKDSADTDHSVYLQLFGETSLGERLRDLCSVLGYVRSRTDVDGKRIALWGDSFARPNPTDAIFKVPHGVDGRPRESEPLGGLLPLFGALFEDDIRAVYVAGGLSNYHGVLTHFAVFIPHDASVPGALSTGDLCDLAGSLAPLPLRMEALVDYLNRPVSIAGMRRDYAPTLQAYAASSQTLSLSEERSSPATWLVEQLR